ncbi:MAG: hypothetical protein K9N55_01185, partial [Phycisphaerae bacterium]|nr:hypothetical protein [Phycisphaerae bacterium]
FERRIPVPGLCDMAVPAFGDVGRVTSQRQAFWYRRSFTVEGAVPETAMLKVHKAKYGMQVWLNGQVVGEHLPCFTPALLDVKKQLRGRGRTNELIIRVGANRESLPETLPRGWDFEKYLYIPGLYDSVELILTKTPRIVNVQTVPEIEASCVRVVVELENLRKAKRVPLTYVLREWRSGQEVTRGEYEVAGEGVNLKADFRVPIRDCRLWSPEDPFLYTLELSTAGDSTQTRFGMRSFRFDKASGRAMLNGKPYFMRGTNVCIYRFFEDVERANRPWRREWVRKLHQRFAGMHWNSIRYCIGFPPDFWYDIADEEGFLIQDEFPIWYLGEWPKALKSEAIAPQYTDWMRERWNHPCVVIWDAQNESTTQETGKALASVRDLDLSNRPWDNGWAAPQSDQDCIESHPYLWIRNWFGGEPFKLSDLAKTSPRPGVREEQKAETLPIVNNEYAWLWLNRDGTPTCLTRNVYSDLIGPTASIPEHRYTYARTLAALTEFWRSHRECAAVMHFCGLGYSRSGGWERPEAGATSDHFSELESLNLDPMFVEYVRDAFAPVGLMIDMWQEAITAGSEQAVPVAVINDLPEPWQGTVVLRLIQNGKTVTEQSQACTVESLGRTVIGLTLSVPKETGKYLLTAELVTKDKDPVRSLRDVQIKAAK